MSITPEKSAIHKLAAERLFVIKKLGEQIEQLGRENKKMLDGLKGWQPIATAPRDGTHIMAWTDLNDREIVFWNDQSPGRGSAEKGYWACANQEHFGVTAILWQPLPDEPTAAQVRRAERLLESQREAERRDRRR